MSDSYFVFLQLFLLSKGGHLCQVARVRGQLKGHRRAPGMISVNDFI